MYSLSEMDTGLHQEICQMIVAAVGDYSVPLPEVVYLIERILKGQILSIIKLAEQVSNERGAKQIDLEDFLFVFRNDQIKLKRLFDFISFDKSLTNDNVFNADEDDHLTTPLVSGQTKLSKAALRFCMFMRKIDTKNELYLSRIINHEIVDLPKMAQLERIDKQQEMLNGKQYEELVNLKYNSFKSLTSRKHQRLKTSLGLTENNIKSINDLGYEVIGFLFREQLSQLVENVLKCRRGGADEITASDVFEVCRNETIELERKNKRKYAVLFP